MYKVKAINFIRKGDKGEGFSVEVVYKYGFERLVGIYVGGGGVFCKYKGIKCLIVECVCRIINGLL